MSNTVLYIYEILDRYTKPLRRLSKETGRFKASVDSTEKSVAKYTRALVKLAAAQQKNSRAIAGSVKHLTSFSTIMPKVTRGMGKMIAAGHRMESTVAQFKQLKNELRGVAAEAARASAKMLGVRRAPGARGVGGARGGRMAAVGAAGQGLQGAVGAAGLAVGIVSVVSASTRMEDAMQDIARVTDIDASGLIAFENQLESMSEELGKTKVGLAQMAFEGGKMGVPIDQMEAFLMMTSRTAIAFDMIDQEAGRVLGSIQAKMGLSGEASGKLLDSLNLIADTTSASGPRMIEIMERLSGVFSLLEFPPEVSAAFAGFADQIEVTPQLAASGMNMMISRMRRMPGMTTKLMENPVKAVNDQLEKMAKMGPELRTKFVRKIFGQEASRFVEKAISNIDRFGDTVKIALSPKAAGSMQRELENKLKRSSKVFEIFGTTVTNTMDTIGDILKPFAVDMAKSFTGLLKSVRAFAKENPNLVKFAAITASIIIVFTGLAIAAGIVVATIGPIFAILAAAAIPILSVITGVSALVLLFGEWKESGHPIIRMISDMGSDIIDILTPFGDLFSMVGDIAGEFDLLGGFVDKLGFAFMATMTPIRIFLKLLKGIVQTIADVLTGDFSGALDTIKSTVADMGEVAIEGVLSIGAVFGSEDAVKAFDIPEKFHPGMGDGSLQRTPPPMDPLALSRMTSMGGLSRDNFLQPAPATMGRDNANVSAGKHTVMPVKIEGNIGISASAGATVDRAEINLNGGQNLAYSGM